MISKVIKRFNCTLPPLYSDILICGGGLIGTTVACALAKHPCFKNNSVTLVEASPQKSFIQSEHYSNRVFAISPFSKHLFEKLEVWKHVLRFKEVKKLNIRGVYSDNFLELENKQDGVAAYIVENDDLLQAISQELHSLPNVKQHFQKNISDVNFEKSNYASSLPRVVLDDGSVYQCQLLVGADGQNSKIRRAMDVNYLSWDYQQMAVVGTLKISECSENTTAWQKFLPEGPVALLPLTNDLSSLVWSTSTQKALNLLKLPDENFVDALNSALRLQIKQNDIVNVANNGVNNIFNKLGLLPHNQTLGLLPIINHVMKGSRAVFPLGFGHSAEYVCPHVVLIGDAAHRVHPLAGQGVNLGFQDIVCLENVLSESVRNGRDLGDFDVLKKYETLSQQNNVPVMAFIELMHRIFTSGNSAIQAFGDISLQFSNSFEPVKELINRKALFSRA